LVSALVNLIAVPWVSFISTPLSLIGVALISIAPTFAQPILWLSDQSIEVFVQLNHFAAQWQWAVWQPPQLTWQGQLSLSLIVLLCLMPRALALLKWTVPLLFLLIVDIIYPSRPYAALTVLDVGQGLAITIESRAQVSVYDAGARSAKFDAGRDIVAPHLRALGFNQIDTAIISHSDNDHSGGALALHNQFNVQHWRNGESIAGLTDSFCRDGQQWTMGDAQFDVLAPIAALSGNAASCVVKLTLLDTTFLMPGDVEKKGEAALLVRYPTQLAADVLIVPHHGSRTSSTAAFVAAIQPTWALISAGYHNRFGHPKSDIVQRYYDSGARLRNTAQTGAIRWEWATSQSSARISFARSTPRRWREPLILSSTLVN
jgi:competence protein ComEC